MPAFRERVLAFRRVKRDIAALVEREHDLLIVGGGIYGAAACWDAAQRGLRTALVEKADFGAGTSWNSLKTIHGGLRHLQRLELRLLRESVRERRAFLRIAPQLVRPLPFLLPADGHGARGREALLAGLRLYDLLAWDRNDGLPEPERIPRSRMLSPAELRERVPGLASGATGGALWTDAQVVNSERLLLAFLHAAADAGASLANAVEVTALRRDGARVTGASARDHEAGADIVLRARVVLNCAGPGAAGLLRRTGLERPRLPLLRAWNFVLRRCVAPGLAVGGKADGRALFVVPWRGVSIVGTDYESADSPGDPQRQRRFLEAVQRAFPWAGIGADDVALVHAGLVPGSRDAAGLWSHSLVVDHERAHGVSGLISAVGAKYTTARAVAEGAVDLALRRLGRPAAACRTAVTPLPAARMPEAPLERQVLTAVREEMALTLADVVLRRTELGAFGPPGAQAETALALLARERGWSAERAADERRALEQESRSRAPALLYNPR